MMTVFFGAVKMLVHEPSARGWFGDVERLWATDQLAYPLKPFRPQPLRSNSFPLGDSTGLCSMPTLFFLQMNDELLISNRNCYADDLWVRRTASTSI